MFSLRKKPIYRSNLLFELSQHNRQTLWMFWCYAKVQRYSIIKCAILFLHLFCLCKAFIVQFSRNVFKSLENIVMCFIWISLTWSKRKLNKLLFFCFHCFVTNIVLTLPSPIWVKLYSQIYNGSITTPLLAPKYPTKQRQRDAHFTAAAKE